MIQNILYYFTEELNLINDYYSCLVSAIFPATQQTTPPPPRKEWTKNYNTD